MNFAKIFLDLFHPIAYTSLFLPAFSTFRTSNSNQVGIEAGTDTLNRTEAVCDFSEAAMFVILKFQHFRYLIVRGITKYLVFLYFLCESIFVFFDQMQIAIFEDTPKAGVMTLSSKLRIFLCCIII